PMIATMTTTMMTGMSHSILRYSLTMGAWTSAHAHPNCGRVASHRLPTTLKATAVPLDSDGAGGSGAEARRGAQWARE
ncbi:MAG TPA: hypothetical protein VIG28_01580, partial [Leifsonia sp.]